MKLHEAFHTSNSFRSFCPRCSFPSSQNQHIAPATLPTQRSWDSILKWISYHFRIIYFCRAWSDHFLILFQSTAPQIAVPSQRQGREGKQQHDTEVLLANCPLSTPVSLSHGLRAATQRGLSGRARATAPSHGHSWGKIPCIPSLYSLQKLKEEGDSTPLPSGKNTASEPNCQPRPTSPLLGNMSRSLPHRPSFPRRQAPTWEASLATQTKDISLPKEAWEAGKPSNSLSQQTQKHALLAELLTDRSGIGGQAEFLLKKGSSAPCHEGRERQGHPGHHSLHHPRAHLSSTTLTATALLLPHYSAKIKVTWRFPIKQTNIAALPNSSFAFVYFAALRVYTSPSPCGI